MLRSLLHLFGSSIAGAGVVAVLIAAFTVVSLAQAEERLPNGNGRNEPNEQPKSVKEFLAKQRAEKARKDHEELLKRGDELLRLTGQLEAAYEQHKGLTQSERVKLDSVEKLAEKIRKSLGGDGDGEDEFSEGTAGEDKPPATEEEAVVDLKEIVVKLVDELKKTTRYSISAAAIQSSNSVLKIVRFLRLKK